MDKILGSSKSKDCYDSHSISLATRIVKVERQMDNISIKFDRFFTGYSSDMKLLMDTMAKQHSENKTHRPLHEINDHNRSFVSCTSSPKFNHPGIGQDSDLVLEKKFLKECKIKGWPLSKACYAAYKRPLLEIGSDDSDSDLELFSLVQQMSKQRKRPAKKKSREMKRYLLTSLQKRAVDEHPTCFRTRYKSDSELSIKSGNSISYQMESISRRNFVKHKTFDNILPKPTNLSGVYSKSEILKKSKVDYQLDANFAEFLSRRKYEKTVKNYPKIFISKPDELNNKGNFSKK